MSDRTQQTRVGNDLSDSSLIESGVQQSTILGPLLYNAATAGLKNVGLSKDAAIIIYADDVFLIKKMATLAEEMQLQIDCETIVSYLNGEGLKINGVKTKLLVSSVSPKGALGPSSPLFVNGSRVEQVKSLRYLGIEFDERLTFCQHATTVATKARRMLHAVSSVLRKWHMAKQLERIYTSCIRPVVTYGIAVSFPKTGEGRLALERLHKSAARISLNTFTISYEEMLKKLSWKTIAQTSERDRMRIMHRHVKVTLRNERDGGHGKLREGALRWIKPVDVRRAPRRNCGEQFYIEGLQQPRLSRTQQTATYEMVKKWNSLPAHISEIKSTSRLLEEIDIFQ